ncbi:MAG: Uma2 family endonuclease, partial [Planctomycetaceae bacterium]
MSTVDIPASDLTAEDLAARVGPIPLWRIRHDPPPGEATEEDVERVRREEGPLCELINGVLVEKAVSDKTAGVAAEIIGFLHAFIRTRRLGWILGADGFVRLYGIQLRAPDVSFVRRNQRPPGGLLERGYSDTAPALAIEVFSPGNTLGEMQQKRAEFFAAGTELFWIVFPDRQEVEVWTSPDAPHTLRSEDTLDGGTVL